MRDETTALLNVLKKLDEAMATVMLGLLAESLPVEKQDEFGTLLIAAGELMQEHARTERPTIVDGDVPQDTILCAGEPDLPPAIES